MNVWTFSGRVGADAELKTTQSGEMVLSFRVANDVGFGARKITQWVSCSYWGKRAEAVSSYVRKGDKVTVSGELKLEEFTGRDGKTGSKLAVRVNDMDLGGQKDQQQAEPSYQAPARSNVAAKPKQPAYADLDDEVPF